jgi:hypothetical protein
MKMVFTATKSGYGPAFEGVFNSLEELKRAIVESSNGTDHYTEELFKECMTQDGFDIYAVDLDDEEEIVFHHVRANEEYHTDSWFTIEKKDKSRFSVCFNLKLDL